MTLLLSPCLGRPCPAPVSRMRPPRFCSPARWPSRGTRPDTGMSPLSFGARWCRAGARAWEPWGQLLACVWLKDGHDTMARVAAARHTRRQAAACPRRTTVSRLVCLWSAEMEVVLTVDGL